MFKVHVEMNLASYHIKQKKDFENKIAELVMYIQKNKNIELMGKVINVTKNVKDLPFLIEQLLGYENYWKEHKILLEYAIMTYLLYKQSPYLKYVRMTKAGWVDPSMKVVLVLTTFDRNNEYIRDAIMDLQCLTKNISYKSFRC